MRPTSSYKHKVAHTKHESMINEFDMENIVPSVPEDSNKNRKNNIHQSQSKISDNLS